MKPKKNRIKNNQRANFTSPGTLKYIGEVQTGEPEINLVKYNQDELSIAKKVHFEDLQIIKNHNNWIEINGLHDVGLVEKIGIKFKLHPLILEDILNTIQKSKINVYDSNKQLFISLKVPKILENSGTFDVEHVAIIMGDNYLISFQEKDSLNAYEEVLERLKKENSKTRKNKIDYLLFVLFDMVVDHYFIILDHIDDKREKLSEEILLNTKTSHQNELYFLKKEISTLKKIVQPLKEISYLFLRNDEGFFSPEINVYLHDVNDHIKDILDQIESIKEEVEALNANYHNQMSFKMNQVMKTLTVFTAIFMPLTFIVGVYGMNFDNMPELRHPNGYFGVLIFMFILSISLWIYFKVKRYI
jgi:magnesium transporter